VIRIGDARREPFSYSADCLRSPVLRKTPMCRDGHYVARISVIHRSSRSPICARRLARIRVSERDARSSGCGIRASDAVSFCMWVQGVYGDGWSYRPIGSAIARSLSDSSFLEPGGVEVTYAMQPRPADPESGEDPRPDGPARSRAVQGVLVEEGVQPTLLWEGVTLPLSAAGMPREFAHID